MTEDTQVPATRESVELGRVQGKSGTALEVIGGRSPLEMSMEFVAELGKHERLATMLVKSGFLPDAIKTPEQALAVMLTGYELELPPMLALRRLYVVNQQVGMAAELMLALAIQRGGVKVEWVERSKERAVVKISRPGWKTHTEEWTEQDSARANLSGKGTHKAYPAQMNGWRALANGLRAICPDILSGLYMIQELVPDIEVDPDTGVPFIYPTSDTRAKASTDKVLDDIEEDIRKAEATEQSEAEEEAVEKPASEPAPGPMGAEDALEIAGESTVVGWKTHPDLPDGLVLYHKGGGWFDAYLHEFGEALPATPEEMKVPPLTEKGKKLDDILSITQQWARTRAHEEGEEDVEEATEEAQEEAQEEPEEQGGDEGGEEPAEPKKTDIDAEIENADSARLKKMIGKLAGRIEPQAQHDPSVLEGVIKKAGLACFGLDNDLPKTADGQFIDVTALTAPELRQLVRWLWTTAEENDGGS